MTQHNNQTSAHRFRSRFSLFAVLTVLFALLCTGRLANLQIVDGESYRRQSERRVYRTISVPAPRGGIYDRFGRALVINRMAFAVSLDAYLLPEERTNEILLSLLHILGDTQLAFTDSLPLTAQAPYQYLEDAEGSSLQQNRRAALLSRKKLEDTATAEEAMAALIEDYDLENYPAEAQRLLAGIRYEMELRDFSVTNGFTIAHSVEVELVMAIEERQELFTGVRIEVVPVREYTTSLASHILGRTGPIPREQTESYLEKGYLLSDTVGLEGIEQSMESVLRGTDGERRIEQTIYGREADVISSVEPVAGRNVILSIDSAVQQAAETALAETVQSIHRAGLLRADRRGADANAGAAVAIDVHSGKIRAMASYPTYDLSTFLSDYAALLADPDQPLFNRAIAGRYAPGSTYKMVSAITGLEEGVVETDTVIVDRGVYTHYAPYTPACWVYNDYGGNHGRQTVVEALQNSCNYYFYEVGRLAGIDALSHWSSAFGLGEKTGVELGGETAGVLAGPEDREKRAQRWYGGDTIQAAIGQSDHLFTPLQLANYIATLANGGTRYRPTLIEGISSYHSTQEIERTSPEVVEQLEIEEENLQAVLAGMRAVSEVGTASSVFGGYPIAVAGKTGSAQVSSGTANGVFVCFAPYEDPEIAIAVVVEHAGSGNGVAPVARAMLDAYFGGKGDGMDEVVGELTLQ
ncbi:MAG: hypothetical protein IJC43_07355 [Clostridia bacterium]|nr:hypothetical protein [Clostridia bacterium]